MWNLIKLGIKLNISISRVLALQLIIGILAFILTGAFESFDKTYTEGQKINVGIINNDNNIATLLLLNNFKSTAHFSGLYNLIEIKEDEMEGKFQDGSIDAAVTIPEGFAVGLYHFENRPVYLVTRQENITKNAILSETLRGFSKYVEAVDMASAVYNDRIYGLNLTKNEIRAKQKAFNITLLGTALGRSSYFDLSSVSNLPSVNSTEYYLAALPLSVTAFLSITAGLRRIKEDRMGAMTRLKLTGISLNRQILAFYISQLIASNIMLLPVFIFSSFKLGLGFAFALGTAFNISILFYIALWRILAILMPPSSFGITAISISFLSSMLAGGLVPYILLPSWVKMISPHTLGFLLNKFVYTLKFGEGFLLYFAIFVCLYALDIALTRAKNSPQAGLRAAIFSAKEV